MKNDELYKILGDVDSEMVEESFEATVQRRNKRLWIRLGAIAACAAFVIGGILWDYEKEESEKAAEVPYIYDTMLGIQEESAATDEVETETETVKPEEIPEFQEMDNPEGYPEAVDVEKMPDTIETVFGGAYINGNGEYTVILIGNTKENRQLICQEMGLSETDTQWVEGTYSYAYLMELQNRISEAMIQGELPYVCASGIYDMENRIVVSVVTGNEEEWGSVLDLDTMGGAIRIECIEGGIAVTDDLIIAE